MVKHVSHDTPPPPLRSLLQPPATLSLLDPTDFILLAAISSTLHLNFKTSWNSCVSLRVNSTMMKKNLETSKAGAGVERNKTSVNK
jgi:hypothetical protein